MGDRRFHVGETMQAGAHGDMLEIEVCEYEMFGDKQREYLVATVWTDEEDARLIAAAPTLLAEVEALLEVIDYGGLKLPDNDRAFILETRLRAAVALARGES